MDVKAKFKFKYKDREYPYEIIMEDMTLDTARYIWTEGNYSCDCNRAGFLGFDEDFDCGEDIELIEYVMTYQPVPKVGLQTIWYDKEIGEGSFGNLEPSIE